MPISFLTAAVVLLLAGLGVGFASGLLGVGGCFIMIPVQVWVYTAMGMDLNTAVKVAFGTNLAVVLPTAMSGAYRHSKKGAVMWKAAVVLGVTGAIGAVIGSTIASMTPGKYLSIAFGCAIILGAVRMLTAKPPEETGKKPVENPLVWAAWGFPLGIVTGIIGIGGGVLMVPVMVVALSFGIHLAVGTSTALMIFTSIGGLLGYIYNGLRVGMPSASEIGHLIGYWNLESWLLLASTSVLMAQVGAKTAHKLPAKQLRYVFIIVMLYMGWKMIEAGLGIKLPI
ncbi:MAG: sulfite exporter TauE/SafE family protein [Candidatus Methanospirare jalkutatii]|nr:sulfite exporter TauE/SafE family protein [Candidatus Methanospirare jalkutatii]